MVDARVVGGTIAKWLSPIALSSTTARLASGVGRALPLVRPLLRSTGSKVPEASMRTYRRLVADPGHVAAALALFTHWDAAGVRADLPAIEVACLLLSPSKDRWIRPKQVTRAAEFLRRCSLVSLSGLGHLAHEEAPERVAEAIESFLR
jgi:magnesium chelatase accessory protein